MHLRGGQQISASALLLLLLLICQPALAENFEVLDAQITLQEEIYHLDSTIRYPLDNALIDALHRGIALPIKVVIEVYAPHRYLPETEVATLKQRYELRFHALTRQYIVTNHNSSVSSSYGSLTRALLYLGKIKNLPLIDQNLLKEGVDYHLRIRAAIDSSQLSIPLRLTSYFYGPWRNESEWWDMHL